jgi:hypothetical protein
MSRFYDVEYIGADNDKNDKEEEGKGDNDDKDKSSSGADSRIWRGCDVCHV